MALREFARDRQRLQRRRTQIVVQHAGAARADHVERAGHRIGRDWHATRQRLEQDEAERVGQAREHEDIGAGIDFREIDAAPRTEEMGMRIGVLQSRAIGAVADDDFRPRQIERQEGAEILLDRKSADEEKDRPRQRQDARARLEQRMIDAA